MINADIFSLILTIFFFVQDEVPSLPSASDTIVLVNKDNVCRMVGYPGRLSVAINVSSLKHACHCKKPQTFLPG